MHHEDFRSFGNIEEELNAGTYKSDMSYDGTISKESAVQNQISSSQSGSMNSLILRKTIQGFRKDQFSQPDEKGSYQLEN